MAQYGEMKLTLSSLDIILIDFVPVLVGTQNL